MPRRLRRRTLFLVAGSALSIFDRETLVDFFKILTYITWIVSPRGWGSQRLGCLAPSDMSQLTAETFLKLLPYLERKGITSLEKLFEFCCKRYVLRRLQKSSEMETVKPTNENILLEESIRRRLEIAGKLNLFPFHALVREIMVFGVYTYSSDKSVREVLMGS